MEKQSSLFEPKQKTNSELKILALDVATKTGFCTETASGVWNLAVKKDESGGMRLIRFKSKLKEIFELEGINLVVFERPAGRFKNPIIIQSELHGVLKTFCIENKIEFRAYSASEIKKFATGNGNANKDAMVESARKYGKEPQDDNEADAIHIFHLLRHELNLNGTAF